MTQIEKETIILFNEEEKRGEVYTYNGKLIRKLTKLCEEAPNEYKLISADDTGAYKFEFPKKLFRSPFGKPLTEERREQLREQALKNGFKSQN